VDAANLHHLIGRLEALRDELLHIEREHAELLADLDPAYAESGRNLLHYAALRRHDLRPLQHQLAALGLSSLGRCERWVLGNLEQVRRALRALAGEPPPPQPADLPGLDRGEIAISNHADALLGTPPPRRVRLLVTLPNEHLHDEAYLRALLEHGMDCARINCAHGDEETWSATLDHLRAASEATGRPCRVFMDLAGPNPRTRVKGRELGRRLHTGDRILLARDGARGLDDLLHFHATLPQIFDDLDAGDRVFVNDGKLALRTIEVLPEGALLEVTGPTGRGRKLKDGKGINLPDTELRIDPLTDADRRHLPFIARHADLIGYSFVRHAADVVRLREELARVTDDPPGLVLKIETVAAFRELPQLLLAAMAGPRAGVMIARGDMAVEGGFERLAEVQEELLWFCEAAHLPVIWATQVLETLVKKGIPARGEITDAAMASRAECVMLNKGPYQLDGVRVLDDILRRMNAHQDKKRSIFRPLDVARTFLGEAAEA